MVEGLQKNILGIGREDCSYYYQYYLFHVLQLISSHALG